MPNPTTKSIVLASASAQRKALLQQMGFDPICVTSDIDETRHANESALAYVQRLAREKCQSVICLLYTSPSPRDATLSRMPSSA